MKFSDAMKLLEEGKKVRHTDWTEKEYIYLNEFGCILDENNASKFSIYTWGEWEEYIEPIQKEKIEEYKIGDYDIDGYEIEEIDYVKWAMATKDVKLQILMDKIKELTQKTNAQTTVLLSQEKEIKNIKEQLDY